MARTVFLYPKQSYEKDQIDVLEYAKRYGEHMIAVKVNRWRSGQIKQNEFMQDLMDLVGRNDDQLINTKTE